MELFTKEGVLGVWRVLLDWAASFRARVDPTARDWSCNIEQCLIFVVSFLNGTRHLTVDL